MYLIPPKSVAKNLCIPVGNVLRVVETRTPDMPPGARTYTLYSPSDMTKTLGSVSSVSGWKLGKRP